LVLVVSEEMLDLEVNAVYKGSKVHRVKRVSKECAVSEVQLV
jgi:hypothetical protein